MSHSHVRYWDEFRRSAMTGANSLFFTIASASLAFCLSWLTGSSVVLGGLATIVFLSSCFCYLLSAIFGAFVSITRLNDARETARVARTNDPHEKDQLRASVKKWERRTWFCFHAQVILLALGLICLVLSIPTIFKERLFPHESSPAPKSQQQP